MTSNELSRWHRYRKCGWSPYERVGFTKITGHPEHHQKRINALSKRTSEGSTVSEYLSWNSCATRNLFQISGSKHLKPLAMLHSYACVSSRKSKPGWVIRIAWRKMSKSSIQKHVWKMKRQQLQFKANINRFEAQGQDCLQPRVFLLNPIVVILMDVVWKQIKSVHCLHCNYREPTDKTITITKKNNAYLRIYLSLLHFLPSMPCLLHHWEETQSRILGLDLPVGPTNDPGHTDAWPAETTAKGSIDS